jgi:TonB family protein
VFSNRLPTTLPRRQTPNIEVICHSDPQAKDLDVPGYFGFSRTFPHTSEMVSGTSFSKQRRHSLFLASFLAGIVLTVVPGSPAGFGQAPKPPVTIEKVTANFTILVGFPGGGAGAAGAALLVPGTVIPLDVPGSAFGSSEQTLREKSLAYTQVVEKLWSAFRLDPTRRLQSSVYRAAETGKAIELPAAEGTNLRISTTMLSYNATTVSYRVVFRQGDAILANSTVPVARGGRAIVGGMDGDAAPYIFLLIAPELAEPVSKSIPEQKQLGITAPVQIQKVNPTYPEEAKKQKIMGAVLLEVVVDTEGKVLDVRILDDPHPLLSNAAAEAVRQWTFTPARKEDGKPVSVRMSISINFKLQ